MIPNPYLPHQGAPSPGFVGTQPVYGAAYGGAQTMPATMPAAMGPQPTQQPAPSPTVGGSLFGNAPPTWFDPKFGTPFNQALSIGKQLLGQGASMQQIQDAAGRYGITGGEWDAVKMGLMPMGTGGAAAGGGNPYLTQMAQAITDRANNNLNFNVLPGLRSSFIGAGGYGGSRQGIAEGVATGLNNQGLAGSLAGLYGGAYESDQNRGLQREQMEMQDRQFGQNFGLQSNMAANSQTLSVWDRMLQGAGLGLDAANAAQNAPMNYYLQFLNAANAAGGQGGTSSQQMPGNPLLGALGGWQLGSSLFGPRP